MAAVKYTAEEDHILMDEVALYNPFQKGHSWEGLKKTTEHETLARRSSKSLRDRVFLLIDTRRRIVKQQEKASGIEEAPVSPFEGACDEVLLLKAEAEEATQATTKRKKDIEEADSSILSAADCAMENTQPSPTEETSTPPPKKRPTTDIVSVLQMKVDEDKQLRNAAKLEDAEREMRRRVEFNLLRADAAEDRELRRDELKLRSRELALREKQEEENKKERQLMIQLIMELSNK